MSNVQMLGLYCLMLTFVSLSYHTIPQIYKEKDIDKILN